MKKTKLLMPILGIPALFATTVPAVVSCHEGEVGGPEEFIMPELGAQESIATLGDPTIGEPEAYQYIMIPNIQWKNPKHVFYGIEARTKVTSEIDDVYLTTKIIPHIETTTFDVMVFLDENWGFGLKAGTKVDFELSIWAQNGSTSVQISESKSYSMIMKTAILWAKKLSYNKIEGGDQHFEVDQRFWLANFDYNNLQATDVTSDGFDDKFGTVTCEASLHSLTGGYGLSGLLQYKSTQYATEFDGDDFTTALTISYRNEEMTIDIDGTVVSPIQVIYNYSPIQISEDKDNVYVGNSSEGQITWVDPDTGKTAGDLDWNVQSHYTVEWLKSIEVSANLDGTVHFKIYTNVDLGSPFEDGIPFTLNYKNTGSGDKYPVQINFKIPE